MKISEMQSKLAVDLVNLTNKVNPSIAEQIIFIAKSVELLHRSVATFETGTYTDIVAKNIELEEANRAQRIKIRDLENAILKFLRTRREVMEAMAELQQIEMAER